MKGRSQSGYQKNKIWISHESQFFEDVSEFVTDNQSYDSRAVAFVDLWNRGVLDVIVANQNKKLLVYKNTVNEEHNWIAFTLQGTQTNKSAIGALVKVFWDGQVQTQIVTGGMGFSSQNQRRLQFGLGKADRVDKVQILWSSGSMQKILNPEIGKVHQLKEMK